MAAIIINSAKIIFYSHLFDEVILLVNLDELKYFLFEN